MKAASYFVNLSRGELVDDAALESALDVERLAGVAIDVSSAADQMPGPRLTARHDVVATLHIGGMTVAARAHQAMGTARQVVAIAAGHMPEGAVNPETASRPDIRFRRRCTA